MLTMTPTVAEQLAVPDLPHRQTESGAGRSLPETSQHKAANCGNGLI